MDAKIIKINIMSKKRTYHDIEDEMIKLQAEYVQLRFGGDTEAMEEYRIPDNFLQYFNGRIYYDSWIQKLTWEEDD